MDKRKVNAKSIRISDEVLTYIENAPGDGFNQKFENIILDAKRTEPERKRIVAHYDELIQKRKEQLSRIADKVESLDVTIQAVFSLQDEVRIIQRQIEAIINDT